MAVESLVLKNIQRFKRIDVYFDERCTTLVGPSDCGKSTIIRTIRWLATNRPAGTSVIRRGVGAVRERTASAHLRVDGCSVKRIRGKGRNLYRLDGESFKALGSGVPEAVERLLNLSSVNVQFQHSPPLLISLTPGQAALALNEVVNLAAIDRVQSLLSSGLRKARVEADVSQARLMEARARRDALAWVPEAEQAFIKVESVFAAVDSLRTRIRGVSQLLDRSQAMSEICRVSREALPVLGCVLKLGELVQRLRQREESLGKLMQEMGRVSSDVQEYKKQAASISARLAAVPRCPVCGSPKKV